MFRTETSETTAKVEKETHLGPEPVVLLCIHQARFSRDEKGKRKVTHGAANFSLLNAEELQAFKEQVARLEWPL